jgi:hypothetical protein
VKIVMILVARYDQYLVLRSLTAQELHEIVRDLPDMLVQSNFEANNFHLLASHTMSILVN